MNIGKNFLYFLCIFSLMQLNALAQTNSTNMGNTTTSQGTPTTLQDTYTRSGDEQTDNETMIQMHQKEEKYRQDKYGKRSKTSGVLGDKGNNLIETGNLTDSEKQLSENYVHQGLVQDKMDELCSGQEMEAACDGREVKHDFMGMDSNMVKALSKAYTMIVGAGFGGDLKKRPSTDSSKDAANNSTDNATKKANDSKDKKDEKQEDYCKYIAIATEVVAMFQQTTAQKNIMDKPTNKETAQADMLYRAARSHDERAKNAKVQRNGWGITAACYTGMVMVAQVDWNLGLKIASSYLMTAFFQNEVKNHEKYRDKVREIADKLPGRGDCNPITQRDCYCSHPKTSNDVRYCVPQLHNNKIAASSMRVTCVDNHLKADPQCSCRATRTCFDQAFMELSGPGFANLGRGTKGPLVKMVNGELVGANGDLGALRNQGAIKNALRKFNDTLKPKGLTKQQKKIAKAMTGLGLPAKVAAVLAQQKSSRKGNSFASGLNPSGGSYSPLSYNRSRKGSGNNILSFSGGNKLKAKTNRKNDRQKSRRKKRKSKNNNGVLKFAEKAASEAGINKDESRPIFEIISRRYQLTAPKRLELE